MTTHTEEMAEFAEHNQDENPRAPPGDAWPPAGEAGGARVGDARERPREVYSFGQNSYGELGHGDTIERHAPTLVAFCTGRGVVQVAAGNEHTVVLCDDGAVYCCGYNDSGQCAIGTTGRVPTLRKVDALAGRRIVHINSANGCEHFAAVADDGELFTCGYNARGQLGHGITAHVSAPRLVEALFGRRVRLVACSYYHTVVATEADGVFGFGRNDFGQLGLGDTADK